MSFADSFWTTDYNLGYRTLFDQLYEGIQENDAYIKMFEKKLELELVYGNQLMAIKASSGAVNSKRLKDDDYVSTVKNAYNNLNDNFESQGSYHLSLSEVINSKVIDPFSKWSQEHKQRIEYSDSILSTKFKVFKSDKLALEKLQKKYFNKCRILEEFKSKYSEEELNESYQDMVDEETDNNDYDNETYNLGGITFSEKTLKALLIDLLTNIDLKDHKVPILGTYNHVSTGSAISHWLLNNVTELNNDIDKAELFGQDLINYEFIRLIGTINNNKNFINSSQFFYQWKFKTFEFTKINLDALSNGKAAGDNASELSRNSSMMNPKSQFTDYFEDVKQVIGVNSVDFNDRTQYFKIDKEVKVLDQKYYSMVQDLDALRCEFEELIMDHLTFMEKCEFDRLKAVKKVLFDFLKIFQNYFKDNKAFLDELLILEETINPVNDLKFLVENFKIGKFKPNVILYDNYYDSNINQIFGVDLTIKSRLDKKIVPILIQCILSHLDKVYPDLVNDEERINLWIKPVQLSTIHNLRFKLNQLTSAEEITGVLKQCHPMIITNLLKLYLLELPDSLISSGYFEIIKSLYLNYPINTNNSEVNDQRINGLQNVLVELPKCNLASLDAILTHLNRLIQIIGKKNASLSDDFKSKLSKELSSILIVPKNHDHFLTESFQYNLMMDLFNNKEVIFKELRRNNSTDKSRESNSLKAKKKKLHSNVESASGSTKSLNNAPVDVSDVTTDLDQTSFTEDEPAPPPPPQQQHYQKSYGVPTTPAPLKVQPGPSVSDDSVDSIEAPEDNLITPSKPKPIEKDAPLTPKSAKSPGLRRSTSPNKKSLNSYIERGGSNSTSSVNSTNSNSNKIVSSKPSKKDIIYSNDLSDLSQPKFAPSLGRKTSVKDLASKFDSPSGSASPSPVHRSSDSSTRS